LNKIQLVGTPIRLDRIRLAERHGQGAGEEESGKMGKRGGRNGGTGDFRVDGHPPREKDMEMIPDIDEQGMLDEAPPGLMDRLWADGWRHFGDCFFRYSRTEAEDGSCQTIQPLRIRLADFTPSKSQRRIWKRNADVAISVVPAVVDDEREALFLRHRERFSFNVPESLRVFMPSSVPDRLPCTCLSVEVRLADKLLAVSYLDVDIEGVSSVYAIFDPVEHRRSLGTLTLLEEIRWARSQGKRWIYPGYATAEPGMYDYKKTFRPAEYFDWNGNWRLMADG
jgi:arginine-tRNA-protein transferase